MLRPSSQQSRSKCEVRIHCLQHPEAASPALISSDSMQGSPGWQMQVEALGELPINQGFRGARVQFNVESAEDVEGKGVT